MSVSYRKILLYNKAITDQKLTPQDRNELVELMERKISEIMIKTKKVTDSKLQKK